MRIYSRLCESKFDGRNPPILWRSSTDFDFEECYLCNLMIYGVIYVDDLPFALMERDRSKPERCALKATLPEVNTTAIVESLIDKGWKYSEYFLNQIGIRVM